MRLQSTTASPDARAGTVDGAAPLTLFSIPKPFVGHTGVIQTNAVMSWARLVRPRHLVLFGNDQGVAEIASRVGAEHLSDLPLSDLGTPYVTDAFHRVIEQATTFWVCYVNADIILDASLARALNSFRPKRPTLIVGQRTDTDIDHLVDFDDARTELAIREIGSGIGKLSPTNAIDYLAFTPGAWLDAMPRFIVGRPGWDNWFLYNALCRGVCLVDGTCDILAIHQSHDYRHVPESTGRAWEGPEADYNRRQIESHDHYFTIDYATHLLVGGQIKRALQRRHLKARWARLLPGEGYVRRRLRFCRRLLRFGTRLTRYYILSPAKHAILRTERRPGDPPRWR